MNESEELKAAHKVLINFKKRAEKSAESLLVETFVDSEPLYDLLSTENAQVVYGRRGTGKTHALKYLAERVEGDGDAAIYVDLRSIGSNGSIYSDPNRSLSERASALVVDVLGELTGQLEGLAIAVIDRHPSPELITKLVDELNSSLGTFRVVGSTEVETTSSTKTDHSGAAGFKAKLSELSVGATLKAGNESAASQKTADKGVSVVHLDFGTISGAVENLISRLGIPRIWLLLDEWSEVPYDLQPYLADLLRRTLITVPTVTIKIGAIEHRSTFNIQRDKGEYLGLELGADIFADLNLDNFLVFDNDQEKATFFFKTLLYRHYLAGLPLAGASSPDALVSLLFTQWPAFEEFVRAVEGVPRDALNLASAVATKAFGQKISVAHVRAAARDWYQQDKAAVIRNTPRLSTLLTHIVDEVIGKRRARAFLYDSYERNDLIERLFDSRLLHVLKRNISSKDEPGARFDVYKIDYGCYVDLINTSNAPIGLFTTDDGDVVEVPKDDYRSIRRAILRNIDLASGGV